MKGRLIMGKNAVKELIKKDKKRIIEIYLEKGDPLAKEWNHLPLRFVSKQELTKKLQTDSHQGVAALVHEPPSIAIETLFKKDQALVLMLDSIMDPQNFGSLLRAAECFGVDAVIWSKNRGVDITPVVSKASVGATELVPLIRVSNLAETIKKFKEHDFWAVTAEVGEGTTSLYTFEFPKKTILIMGSEGKGVQPIVSKQADFKVFIPMQGQIDSLNVSQATAIFLFQYKNSSLNV